MSDRYRVVPTVTFQDDIERLEEYIIQRELASAVLAPLTPTGLHETRGGSDGPRDFCVGYFDKGAAEGGEVASVICMACSPLKPFFSSAS